MTKLSQAKWRQVINPDGFLGGDLFSGVCVLLLPLVCVMVTSFHYTRHFFFQTQKAGITMVW